jgi:nicotinate phosphoribosyltransferase
MPDILPNSAMGSLLGDEYALEMMRTYYMAGKEQTEVVMEVYFRKAPFKGSYAVAIGTNQVARYLASFQFSPADIAYVRTLGFEDEFVDRLVDFRFTGTMQAVPEGTLVFPNEPIIVLSGTIAELTFFEGRILNIINPQTLVGTKASRVVAAAAGDDILEMGLRRAHGYDAAVWHSRAAYIAGVNATANLEAGRLFGLPVRGTHGHALVMFDGSEYEAFKMWATSQIALGRDPIFLVDTYDVLNAGIPNAIRVCLELNCRMGGIRLDSGDLAYLSKEARKLLDVAGFTEAKIIASGDLDEYLIRDLKGADQHAPIDIWGVGTNLIVAYDQPALGGVYKLAAVKNGADWAPCIKLSENPEKITTPGLKRVIRFRDKESGKFLADLLLLDTEPLPDEHQRFVIFDPIHPWKRKALKNFVVEELLIPFVTNGGLESHAASDWKSLTEAARQRCEAQFKGLWPEYRRVTNPEIYPVDLSEPLWALKHRLILAGRQEQ